MRLARSVHHHTTLAAAVAALTLAGLTTGCGSDGDGATAAARSFLSAWAAGDERKAASFTDDPKAARAELTRFDEDLNVTKAELTPGRKKGGGDSAARVPFRARITLRGVGTRWTYASAAKVRKGEHGWKVHFTPSVLHPALTGRTHLMRYRTLPTRAGILAADGTDLAATGKVWAIAIWPAKLSDPDRAYKALGDPALGADIDIKALKSRVDKAAPDQSVPVVTLRDEVYRRVREKLLPIAGLQFRDSRRALPTAAKALVGTVGPASKETLANAGPQAADSDDVGATGLQYRYQRTLAGTPGVTIRIIDKETKEASGEVFGTKPKPGRAVRTTIDRDTQKAADAALSGLKKNASLVAVRPSTGEVLAVANNPGSEGNRAFTGRYAPGSTFKVVTAAALLEAGVEPGTAASCPRTATVNGQKFENQAEFVLPKGTTFREDFAQSCNTGFIGLRGKLDNAALTEAAGRFGIGGEWQVGAASFDGSAPAPTSENEKAADMIGQGKVEASPLVMASIAATVRSGSFHQPVLVPDAVKERHKAAEPLDPDAARQLRTLMRAVVTEGSGKALRGIGGEPGAKTGTAEFGQDTPPHTHAWMIGFRGDLAFAVLLEDGGSGGRDAGPVAARFLKGLG
ncbi:penicillin-binding transpeptidase domain-containing protein [Wenjunlia tyrosinilytica]|uniref:Penicillin-binding protein n=1 Tax=Wenjunlia tyrosinilytica TaxID=1544741 RepID=A0A917ZGA0_9ACTN|nr:penicillin-binding transpeptidase domain-containing protein [Wenjunlia tyrosinilytica]GGO82566.1 penicillin-binding protein [Wenjunlia tyrosinilytica]